MIAGPIVWIAMAELGVALGAEIAIMVINKSLSWKSIVQSLRVTLDTAFMLPSKLDLDYNQWIVLAVSL